jgi:hypothetical protein
MTNFRALCSELHAAFNTYAVDEPHHDLLVRARAALAQPEPQGPGPDDVTQLYYKHGGGDGMYGGMGEVNFEEAVEEALARWSRPAKPEPQGVEPTDDELQKIADALRDEDDTLSLVEYARAVLARHGRPAIEPVPEAHNG